MDTVCTASTDNIVLAPSELLPTTIDTNAALIGHSSEYQQQLHQFLRKYFPSSPISSSSAAVVVVNENKKFNQQQ